jgi:NTE family protein
MTVGICQLRHRPRGGLHRTTGHVEKDVFRGIQQWKTRYCQALAKLPEDRLSDEERRLKSELAHLPETLILHIIYQQKAYEGHAKDYEFSGA